MSLRLFKLPTGRGLIALAFLSIGLARSQAAVAIDPKSEGLSSTQRLESASWQAEQSQIEKTRVGRQRFERHIAYKRDIIEGLRSEQAMRQETIHPGPDTSPNGGYGQPGEQNHPILWAFALCGGGFMLHSLLRKGGFLTFSAEHREILCGTEGEAHFSKFAEEFVIGPTVGQVPSGKPDEAGSASLTKPQQTDTGELSTNRLHAVLGSIPEDLAGIRQLLSEFAPGPDRDTRQELIGLLLVHLRSIKTQAGVPDLLHVWQITCALENLLQQLVRTPAGFTLSAVRTVVSAVDLLHSLCVEPTGNLLLSPPVRLLAVDDDAISRHAVALALKKVLCQPDLAADGEAGLAMAQKQAYDAVFLDLEMPGLDGFEVCSLIHGTVFNRNTPVVFVTSHSGFAERSKSSLVGGHDLIGKPFLVFELALSAITLVLRRRLQACPITSLAVSLPQGGSFRKASSKSLSGSPVATGANHDGSEMLPQKSKVAVAAPQLTSPTKTQPPN